MFTRYRLGLLLLACLLWNTARAQLLNQHTNWFFGDRSALSFASGTPLPLPGSQSNAFEGCASISNASGVLQCYTNGYSLWNRNHQLMPNGASLGGHDSSTQGVMLLPHPGNANQYLLFMVDAAENNLMAGLRYSLIDMTLQGGLGDVTATKGVRLPTPTLSGRVAEKLTATRHANGRDWWVIVHGWTNADFYCFLVSAGGVAATPVVSTVGPLLQDAMGTANAIGGMRAASNGAWVAMTQFGSQAIDLFGFDNATGRVTSHLPLGTLPNVYGVEFSASSRRLYFSASPGNSIVQFNLEAGSGAQIAASRVQVSTTDVATMQLGPDGKIYGAMLGRNTLSYINNPDGLGAACDFRAAAVPISGQCRGGLPNVPYSSLVPTAAFTLTRACWPDPVQFVGQSQNVPAASTYEWNFGDPASGPANTATGNSVAHGFSAPGTFTVTLTVRVPGSPTPLTATQQVRVDRAPVAMIGAGRPDTALCLLEQTLVLRAAPVPAGATLRWPDGSTGPTYTVTEPGTYALEVSLNDCRSRDEIRVSSNCRVLIPNVITPDNGDQLNQTFVLQGLQVADWSLAVFNRWGTQVYQASHYANDWSAAGQPAGVYYYLLRNATTGQRYTGWVEVIRAQ